MEYKISPTVKASIFASCTVLWKIIRIIFLGSFFLSFPIVGYIYFQKIGMALGSLISVLLFFALKCIRKLIRNRTAIGMLVHVLEVVTTMNCIVLGVGSFMAIIAAYCGIVNISKPTWQLLLFHYYCVVVPTGIVLGTGFSFCFEDMQGVFRRRKDSMYDESTLEKRELWRKDKFMLKYFNPILLPFTLVVYSIIFLVKGIKMVWLIITDIFQKKYQEVLHK